MKRQRIRFAVSLACTLAFATLAHAAEVSKADAPKQSQEVTPKSFEWMVIPCPTWTCASAKLLEAAGDQFVVSVPTTATDYPWLIVRRVPTGSFYIPPEAPFTVETYEQMVDASSRFSSIDTDQAPVLMTPVDGKKLVIFLRVPQVRRRPAAH